MTPQKQVSPLHSLRFRLVFSVLCVVIFYGIAEFLIQQRTTLRSFSRLEQEQFVQNLRRCVSALKREQEHLKIFVNDWSVWDDTYDFIQTHNPRYVEANLYPSVFSQNKLNFISFRDENYQIVWEMGFDLNENIPDTLEIDIPTEAIQQVIENADEEKADAALSGLARSSKGPMILAICPIMRSNDTGPVRGVVIMGRLLTNEFRRELREQLALPLQWKILEPSDSPTSLLNIYPEYQVETISTETSLITSVLLDMRRHPILELNLTLPRVIYQEGYRSALIAYLLTLGAGVTTLLVLIVLAQKMVVRPLLQLTQHATAVNSTGNLHMRMNLCRKDEIGLLAAAFDQMLARLQEDFEKRIQVEHALQENETRLQTILETVPDGILVLDELGKVTLANPAAVQILRISEGLENKNFCDLLADEHGKKQWGEAMTQLAKGTNSRVSIEFEASALHGDDGSIFPIYISAGCFLFSGKRFYTIALKDLTEFKTMQEKALRSERLATIGEMSAAIAHELRNPLAGISGFLQLLQVHKERMDSSTSEMVKEALAQVARMENTVHRLLMFARPWQPDKKIINLRELIEIVQCDISQRPEFKNIQFVYENEDKKKTDVHADPQLLRQVFINLFENAAHAMQGKGTIYISLQTLNLDTIRIQIRDTGPGLSSEAVSKAFHPFFTTKTKGTGLGLAICKQIIEAHDGKIILANAPEGGATAIVEIPQGENLYETHLNN